MQDNEDYTNNSGDDNDKDGNREYNNKDNVE
jgi:hypothetical protein